MGQCPQFKDTRNQILGNNKREILQATSCNGLAQLIRLFLVNDRFLDLRSLSRVMAAAGRIRQQWIALRAGGGPLHGICEFATLFPTDSRGVVADGPISAITWLVDLTRVAERRRAEQGS